MWRQPESWRALPRPVRRRVLRDAQRGLPPPDETVAHAAREWAERTVRITRRLLVAYAVLFVVNVALALADSRAWALQALSMTFGALGAWLVRRQARQVLRTLATRPDA